MSVVSAPQPLSPLRSSAVFVGRSLKHALRDGEGIVMAVIMPVVLMLMFTFIFGGAILGQGYLQYVVPAVIILCVTQGSAAVATAVNRDIVGGLMNRFRTMPIVSPTALVGPLVSNILRCIVAAAIVLLIAVLLGYRTAGGFSGNLGAIAMTLGYIVTISAVMIAIGVVSSSAESASGYGFLFFVLPYFSGGFAPVSTMPAWLQGFAGNQPYTLIIETLRGCLNGTPVAFATWAGAAAWCLGITLLAAIIGSWRFRTKIR